MGSEGFQEGTGFRLTHLESKIRRYKDRAHAYEVAAMMARDNKAPKRAMEFQRKADSAKRKVFRYERAEKRERANA